jgi:hypothetical protein
MVHNASRQPSPKRRNIEFDRRFGNTAFDDDFIVLDNDILDLVCKTEIEFISVVMTIFPGKL